MSKLIVEHNNNISDVQLENIFTMKFLERLGIPRTFLNIIKSVCKNLIANIYLNGEKLKITLLKS